MMVSFQEKIYLLLGQIPNGRVSTYKILAKAAGRPRAWRVVGGILNKNKNLVKTPCHRIIKSDGSVGGYARGARKKENLLTKEGIKIKSGKVIDFTKILYKFYK